MARPTSDLFLSCDWGTSALRLRLVAADGRILSETCSSDGIAVVHRNWVARGAIQADREPFYLGVLRAHLDRIAAQVNRWPDAIPLVISGMVGASIGLRELSYQTMPLDLDGTGLITATLPLPWGSAAKALLISGARIPDDVMRGEETQLVGAHLLESAVASDGIVVLPGTHSKHVEIRAGKAVGLKTYMTGEFFDLLSHRSILANSIGDGNSGPAGEAAAAFAEGVRIGAQENLLHASFGLRVAEISGKRSRSASWHFLSGMVIGAELADLMLLADPNLTLVGNIDLTARYQQAFTLLGRRENVRVVAAEAAVIAGQRAIATHAGLLAGR